MTGARAILPSLSALGGGAITGSGTAFVGRVAGWGGIEQTALNIAAATWAVPVGAAIGAALGVTLWRDEVLAATSGRIVTVAAAVGAGALAVVIHVLVAAVVSAALGGATAFDVERAAWQHISPIVWALSGVASGASAAAAIAVCRTSV